MLLIVTIGLVLVAAVILVIGLVSNSLPLILISIVCSVLAAVLLLAFRYLNRGRRKAAGIGSTPFRDTTPPVFSSSTPAPAPRRHGASVLTGAGSSPPEAFAGSFDDEDRPRFAEPPVTADRPTRPTRRLAPAPARATPPPPVPAPAPAPVAAPAAAPAEPVARSRPEPLAVAEPSPGEGPSGATSMDTPPVPVAVPSGGGVAAGSAGLPIEDYDFLGVSEILPLLSELYPDELEQVRDYEQRARGRATITYRIDVLLDAADAAEAAAEEAAAAAQAPEPEPAAEPEPVAEEPSGPALPIADYDRLRVFQILSLLADLSDDDLHAVRDYEEAGRGRITIINDIDTRLAGDDAVAPAPEPVAVVAPAPVVAAPAPPAPVEVPAEDWTGLPIAEYDDLTQQEILPLLDELYDDELELVRDYEDAHRARAAVLFRIDALLGGAEDGQVAGEAEPEPEDEAPPEPVAVEEEVEAEVGDDAGAAAPEIVWGELPIADYDDLTQQEILPLLDELYEDELELVRDYEDAHRARAAVIFRIDALLSGADDVYEEVETEPEDEAPPVAEPEPEAPPAEEAEDVAWGELPIADYDELSVDEILPLLDELYDDELELIEDYEDAHRARNAIISRIDALFSGVEVPELDSEGDEALEAEPLIDEEPAEEEPAAEELVADDETQPAPSIAADDLPIADYDDLTVGEILPLLAELYDDELEQVRDYESANQGRTTILARIDALFEPFDDDEPEEEFDDVAEEAEDVAADDAETEGDEAVDDEAQAPPTPPASEEPATEEPATEEDFEGEEDEAYEDEEESPAEEGDEGDEGDTTFPIADYDELRVVEILPLLSQLQADELDMVARHEEQLANRVTILNRIQRLLQLSEKENPS